MATAVEAAVAVEPAVGAGLDIPFWTAPQASDFLQGHAAASAAKRFFRPDRDSSERRRVRFWRLRAVQVQILGPPGPTQDQDFGHISPRRSK